MFTADVAVEDQDEIPQDSSCMHAYSQRTLCRVVCFWIDVTAPAVGLSSVPPKTTKSTQHTIGTISRFLAAQTPPPQKKKTHTHTRTHTHDSCSYLPVRQ